MKRGTKIGVLLIHGFTSTPQETRFLANYLSKKKITVYAPLLPGHGTCVEDLARTRWHDWEKAALKGFDKLSKIVDNVYVIGNSVGGNLAFRIAKQRKSKGIVTMGTPMFFKRDRSFRATIILLGLFKNFVRKRYTDEKVRKLVENKIHYTVFPLNCLGDVIRLMRTSEKDLAEIKTPTLVMQSATDQILTKENAELIYKKLAAKEKRISFIPDSYHVFCMDKHKGKAFRAIYKFIKETSLKKAS